MQLFLGSQAALARCGDHKLSIVNESTVVGVDSTEHFLDFLVRHNSSVVLQVAFLDFVHGKLSVTILVEGSENLGQVVTLLLAHQLRGDESISSLLEGNV